MAKSNSSSNGIGFFGLLTIALVVLKLTGVLSWSWLWILAPLGIPFIIAFVFLTVLHVIGRLK